MPQQKINLTNENYRFLKRMAEKGVGKSALVNLALSILMPRLTPTEATEESIIKAIFEKKQ
ncbi:MAG: hypothetical protein LC109_12720 [Bacteroidia bacterium]|nr:hypothetical protein [Bacteroidia bacterium]